MIDAYEIGIQLLLQEDVSAGLAVINRELAEVDRAIAATSANLAGLVHAGATTPKAVAVAGSGQAVVPPKTEDANPAGEQAVQGQSEKEAVATSDVTSGQKAAAPEMIAPETSVPTPRPAATSPSVDERVPSLQAAPESTVSSSAPVRGALDTVAVSGQATNDPPAEPEPPVSAAPAQVVSSAPAREEFSAPLVQAVAKGGQDSRRSVTPPSGQVATVTASVHRTQASASPSTPTERSEQQPSWGTAARDERPAAPWLGVKSVAAQAEKTPLRERAAAPQGASRTRDSSGGGTVMLDGRLVGQWLSEHMGREASRPPAGTSFFDARQTPAWNVSGAL